MQTQFVVLALLCAALPCAAQQGNISDWPKLIKGNEAGAARALCTPFEDSKILAEQVEAEKCLANVALMGADAVKTEKDENGQFVLFDEYIPAAVDESLKHLNRGLELAPQDLSLHQGRLHVLEISRRYSEMVKALDESCTLYHGKEAPDVWLAYASEVSDRQQYQTALDLARVLDRHYPNNPDIVGNIGAFLAMQGKLADAVPYLQKAVELAPQDPINVWDLARVYDYLDQDALAEQWYQKALPLDTDADRKKGNLCLYAAFVEKKLKDGDRACALEKQNCPADEQTACAAPASTGAASPKSQ